MMVVIRGGIVMTPAGAQDGLDVVVEDGRIAAIGPAAGSGAAVIDASGHTVMPGLIDVHVHGGGGHSLLTRDPGQIRSYARWVVRHGVTGFLIGAAAPDAQRMRAAVEAARAATEAPLPGSARVLGFHFEGPFINPMRHGAFDPRVLRAPSVEEIDAFLGAAGPLARLMTIAPELPGAEAAIRRAVARGMRMSMGHTDATCEQARAGFEWGITHVTHTFNAMRPFNHREPGAIGAALTTDNVTCEIIGDTLHVHPAAMLMLIHCKGPARTVLVTDGIELAGSGEGTFRLGGRPVSVQGGVARLADGTIAGSITTMDANLRNVVALGVPLADAVRMASTNPARVAGAGGRTGTIAPGMDADLVLLDADLQVRATIVQGVVAYEQDSRALGGWPVDSARTE